jgi:fibronectin-binding autotransporter adhesin
MLHINKIYAILKTFVANKSTRKTQLVLLLSAGLLLVAAYAAPWSVESKRSSLAEPSTGISGGPSKLALNAALQSGMAQPLSLATEDFDGDGIADLVSGYSTGSGILMFYRGNSEATAPSKPDVLEDIKIGRFAPPFLPEPTILAIPEPPDFLAAGDFNRDGYKDVLAAARGSQGIYVLKGNGMGGFAPAEEVFVPGAITALTVGKTGARDGLPEIAVGVSSGAGSKVLIFEGASQGLWGEPSTYDLPAAARALALGELNDDQSVDLAVASGNRVLVIPGRSEQEISNGSARAIEQVTFPFSVAGITVGQFIWDREGRSEMAAMSEDGTIQFVARGDLDKRPYTDQEEDLKIQNAIESKRQKNPELFTSFMKSLVHRQGKNSDWVMADTMPAETRVTGQSPVFFPARVSNNFNEDLVFAERAGERLGMLKSGAEKRSKETLDVPERLASLEQSLPGKGESSTEAATADSDPVAVLPMRLNLDTKIDFVVLRKGQVDPLITINVSNAAITVDRTDDNAGATACTAAASDCSLRGAIIHSNTTADDDTIVFPAGAQTYTLTLGPFDDEFNGFGATTTSGDLDIRDAITSGGNSNLDGNLTIAGNGIDTTIVQAGATQATGIDRVFDINNFGGTRGQIAVVFSNMTIRNGNVPGYDVDPSAVTQLYQPDGGGIQIDGFDSNPNTAASGAVGSLTVTGCKVTTNLAGGQGGGIKSAAATLIINSGTAATEISSNQTETSSGGGIHYLSGNTIAAQNLQITGANITLNTAGGNASTAIGGGISVQGTSPGVPASLTSCTITNNTSTAIDVGDGSGGGGIYADDTILTITGGSITSNKANSNGGGILFVGPTGTFNNVNISSNTADFNNDNVGNGGGIYHDFGTLTIGNATACTINSNTANNGGGVYVTWDDQSLDSSAALTMTNGTISSNNAKNNGGGLVVDPGAPTTTGNVTLNTVTLQSNTANSDSSGGGDGGGIYVNTGTINSLNGVTIDSNAANSGSGDGIRLSGGSITGAGTLNINGGDSLYFSGGTFTSTAGTLNLTGNFTRDTANTFSANGGTFNFNGTVAQLINGTATSDTFNNFIVNKSAGTLATGGSTTSLIMNNLTMTLGTFTAPATLDINGNTLLTAGTLTAGTTITAAGNWTNNGGTFTPGAGLVTFDGAVTQTINGTAVSQTFNNFAVNKGGASTLNTGGNTVSLIMNNLTMTLGNFTAPATLDINGDTLLTAGTLTAGANITAGGNWTNNGGTFTSGSGTVTFDTAAANNLNGTAVTQTFNNFVLNKSGGSLTGAGNTTTLTLNGSMTLTAGTLAAGTITAINLPGNWTNNGGTFTPGSSNVTFNSTTAAQSINGTAATQTFFTITVNKTGQTLSTGGSTTALDLDGSLVLTAGTFPSPANLNIGGSFTEDTGFTFTPPPSITFDGSTAGNINGTLATKTFNDVVINKTNSLTGSGGTTAIDINGNLTITAGTLVAGTATTITVFGNWTNNGTFTGGSGTVIFDGNNNTQTLTGTTTFNNLTINHTGTGNVTAGGSTLTVSGLARVQGGTFISSSTFNNVQIDSGQSFQGTNATTMNVSGNWTNNGGTFTANGNTVNFNGGAAQTIGGTSTTQTFDNFTVNKTAGIAVTVGGSTTTLDINGNVILTLGTFAAGTATAITVAGNWTNNGGLFTAGSGTETVTFDGGAGQTIGGTTATTFNNLTNGNGSGLAMNNDNTVNKALALTSSDITVANTKTLTQPVGGSSTGGFDVIGSVKRIGFVSGGSALSFGNPFNSIKVDSGAAPSDIVVKLTKTAPATFTTAVTRTYTITPNGGSPSATLRLHYLDTELNGNTETLLDLWRFNGAVFVDQGQTTRDSVNNWVEKSGVTTFSDWTLANHVNQAPSITPATTVVGAQTTSGLVIDRQVADAATVNNFKITNITNGTLFKNNGTTQINNNDFITYAEGNAGLKFTPTPNSTATGSFDAQSSFDAIGSGLSPAATGTITVNQGTTTTTITSDSPDPSGVGQVVAVNFTVVPNLPSTGTPTGNVVITVNDASGDTCTGTVAAGTCNLTLTTTGSKTLTATYAGDSNFITSMDTEPHDVSNAPNAVDDNYSTFKNTTLNIAAPGVLANDTGGPTVTAVGGCIDTTDPFTGCATTAGGTVTVNGNGSFSYTPPSAVFTGADSFTYTATNGGGSDTATVNISVVDTFINEILFNPPGTDAPNEYIELRGTASAAIPAGTYLVAIEGDSADNLGDVQTIINLSGLTFGSNGFLVLLQNGNTYTTVAGATVITSTTTGFGGLPGSIWSADSGATDIEDASVTFMVIQTGTAPTLTSDIDTDDNGTPDGATFTSWSVIDSIGALDGTATTDRTYGAINYSNNTGTPGSAPGTPILVAFTAGYLGRSGDTTGSTSTDWVASGALGGAQPNWTLSATETEPIAFANQPLNHIGTTNFDVSPPTVQSITRVNASPTNATSVDFLVTFSESVTGVDSTDFALTTTGVSGASIGTVTGSGATRTVTVNTGTLSGTIRLDLTDDDSIKDGSNNALGGVGAGNGNFNTGEVYTIDKSAPTVDITDVTPDPRTTSVSSISIVFSEAITGFDLADLSLTRDAGGNLLTGSQTLTTSDNITWTLGNLSSLTGADGNYALTLTSGGIADNAGNALSAGASDTWAVNAAAPTVDITDVTPDPRNTSVSSIAIVFSEAVSGFDIGDLALTRNGGSNLLTGAQTLTSGDNITWSLGNLSGLTGSDGSYTLTLTAPGGITDGGGASLASGATDTWVMDATGPTVTINQASGQADPTSSSPINFTVVFNEAVANFITGDVTFSGAGATTATVTETAPNNGTTYNVAVTGMNASGVVTASLLAGVASDALGNLSQASSSTDNSVTFNFVTNNAPVLDNTGNMSLGAISEDIADASNTGTLVSAVIASAGGDRITDVDAGAVEGLAVTAVDNSNGTWQFSTNGGGVWTAFGSPTNAAARLLADNANTRVRFVPNADFNGTVNPGITFRAWDQTSGTNGNTADASTNGGTTAFSTATETASIIVTEVNDAPTATGEALTNVAEDSGQRTIPFGDLTANDSKGAANESGQTLIVNTVSNPVGGTVSISAGNVLFTPGLDFNGPASFQYTVQDNGTTNGGADFKTSNTVTATFTVTAVNDAPVNTVPGAQNVTQNSSLTFSAANANQISIADVDAGSNPVQVQLTATNGTITLSGISGLSFTVGDGTADATMTFTGTIANINAALNGMVFTPTAGFNGAASLQIVTNDQGNTGSGGALSDTDTVNITVVAGGTLQFSAATYSVSESGVSATITITRTGGTTGTATVQFSTSNGTATAGSDYTAVTNQTVTFNDGDTSKTVSVAITNDALDENDETVNLTLSSPGGSGALGSPAIAVLTINDDDATPSLSINDVSLSEGNSGTTNFTFTVTLSAASGLPVTVNYATANGTADATDYTAVPSTLLTFNPGDTTKTVNVLVNGDTVAEINETFFVNLSGATNAAISDNQGLGTILNDDGALIQFNSATYTISEGASNTPEGFASLTVQVDRIGDLSGAATVRYATSDLSGSNECTVTNGNASQRCDYLMLSGTLRFAAGEGTKTFQIPIVNDGYVEGAEVFTISLSNVTGATLGTALTTVTITDDDSVATDAAHNPYLNNSFFVRMHYVDFLEREPDTAGFNDWVGVLNGCGTQHGFLGAPSTCDRAHISKGFFGATEFIDRGFLVYRLYDVGLNRLPLYAEYNPDSAQLRGFGLTTAEQTQNLNNYLTELGARAEFVNRYAAVATTGQATQLIQLLETTAGVTLPATATTLSGQPTQYGRGDLISKRSSGQFSVVETVKAFVEQQVVYDKYFPRGFVTMQYFAYLHRDPDTAGWSDWLDVLVNGRPSLGVAPGDYNRLIFGFIYSTEYRKRFGQP